MKLTIFTPLYNRKKDVVHLYESLKRQTVFDFEWLVVDDGSTDNPEELFDGILSEDNSFEILFLWQPNGGKHRAWNRALCEARGEYFVVCDSDDWFTDVAIERVFRWLDEIRGKEELAGVAGLKEAPDGNLLLWKEEENGAINLYGGQPDFEEYLDAGFYDILPHGMRGDRCEIIKTEVLRKYPFPEYEGENFLTEGILYNRMIRDGIKLRWHKETLEICEYQEGGLTQSGLKKFIDNPKGYATYIREDTCSDEERNNSFYDYYLRLKGCLQIEEIAKNLGIEDSSFFEEMRKKRQADRQRELSLMEEVLNTRINLESAGMDLYQQMLPQLKQLLKQGLRNKSEGLFVFETSVDEAKKRIETEQRSIEDNNG